LVLILVRVVEEDLLIFFFSILCCVTGDSWPDFFDAEVGTDPLVRERDIIPPPPPPAPPAAALACPAGPVEVIGMLETSLSCELRFSLVGMFLRLRVFFTSSNVGVAGTEPLLNPSRDDCCCMA